ncbi:hypothetical protein ZEAMMB73_Zm00001d042995 [Zea mays]|uniref:Uncharacterized protein n=1 Tax=Zea mays TaxID=4577 RepID=A0A1D6N7X7_MAIZE|nr:hypothetical protein ZEAMMB73_Zm00001d042995 [Zea mays]
MMIYGKQLMRSFLLLYLAVEK